MMSKMNLIGWIKTRWLGMVIGFVLIGIAITESEALFGLMGGIVIIQTITGKGCFGGSCEI